MMVCPDYGHLAFFQMARRLFGRPPPRGSFEIQRAIEAVDHMNEERVRGGFLVPTPLEITW